MATEQKSGQEQTERGMMEGGVGSPVSNDAYNVLACLHEKLEGLEAMRKFSKDADDHIWKKITQLDVQAVDVLIDQLEEMVKNGKLRSASSKGQRPTARS
jgi:hypothetical protein